MREGGSLGGRGPRGQGGGERSGQHRGGGGRLDDRTTARGEESESAVADTERSDDLGRLVTADQVTDRYTRERANP
ncbi:hypothetical protein SHKM778_70970 [Streptomyces sp. KM77-8]|uniref:Uncharacterized protein n=1 Tax=Streptomyces haneummycinicus TaxID=3074435 RepID=A0AAT9HT97_9ACTN